MPVVLAVAAQQELFIKNKITKLNSCFLFLLKYLHKAVYKIQNTLAQRLL